MKLSKANVPFTMVANEVLSRADLSLKAKGLYAYLFSKPDDWDFAADRIAKECKEERKAVMRVLKELEVGGLLTRIRQKNSRMEYHLAYTIEPQVELTHPLFAVEGIKIDGKAVKNGLVGTLEGIVVGSPSPIDGLNDLIKEFEPVNPSFARLFANKTQRGALTRVVQSIGFDKTRNAIKAAVACHGRAYAPTVTTPVQLEEKLGSLASFFKKQGGPAVVAI